jgi:hypothetical protein
VIPREQPLPPNCQVFSNHLNVDETENSPGSPRERKAEFCIKGLCQSRDCCQGKSPRPFPCAARTECELWEFSPIAMPPRERARALRQASWWFWNRLRIDKPGTVEGVGPRVRFPAGGSTGARSPFWGSADVRPCLSGILFGIARRVRRRSVPCAGSREWRRARKAYRPWRLDSNRLWEYSSEVGTTCGFSRG